MNIKGQEMKKYQFFVVSIDNAKTTENLSFTQNHQH